MKTLKVFKNSLGTILITEDNIIVSYYHNTQKQPRRNKKTITHNCFNYSLEWLNQTILAVSKKLYSTDFNSKTPISKEVKEKMLKDTKNLPLIISFINDYQFRVKLKTSWVH